MPVTDIGIDLGSSNILVYSRGKGIVIREPSVAAYDKDNDKIVAFGEEARQMIEHTQGNIVAIRPLKSGVISDYSVTGQGPRRTRRAPDPRRHRTGRETR